MSGLILIGALLLASAKTPLVAGEAKEPQEPHVIGPAGGWQVDFAQDRCRAFREFGPEDTRTILVLEPISPTSDLRWLVAGGAVSGGQSDSTKIDIQFGPGFGQQSETMTALATYGDYGRAFRGTSYKSSKPAGENLPGESGLPLLAIEDGQAISWVEVSIEGGSKQRLATGPMGDLFKVLNSCTESLVTSWGYDLTREKSLRSRAKLLNLEKTVHKLAYLFPRAAIKAGLPADLFLRVTVGSDGRSKACEIIELTSAERYGDAACKVFMKTAHFKPALGADGQPTESFFATTVAYRP